MATGRTDAELMAAFQRGEGGAFDELVERHQAGLLRFLGRMTPDRAQAEDWAQEVFLRVVTHAASYVPRAKFTTFLFRIARNLWIDALRERAHRPRPVSFDAAGEVSAGAAAKTGAPPDTAIHGEVSGEVRRAIDRLPEEQRVVVLLSEWQGMKYAEIGEILDVPVGTVKSRMHTAMQRLRVLLAPLAEEGRR